MTKSLPASSLIDGLFAGNDDSAHPSDSFTPPFPHPGRSSLGVTWPSFIKVLSRKSSIRFCPDDMREMLKFKEGQVMVVIRMGEVNELTKNVKVE
ncbi:MAG: hypothetical protein ACTSXJ_02425 [Candidatus Baldrarchaeia archaeon]